MTLLGGRVWFAGCIMTFALLVGCGDDEPGSSSCGRVLPCGGDLVGTWKVETACLDDAFAGRFVTTILNESLSCSGATAREIRTEASGSISFTSDSTYNTDMSAFTSLRLALPSSCSDPQNGILTCEQLNEWFAALTKKPFDTFVCTSAASGCNCAVGLRSNFPAMGTYSSSGTTATLGTDKPMSFEYCVRANELHLMTVSTDSGPTVIKTDILATK